MLTFFKDHSTKIAGVVLLLGLGFNVMDWPAAKILIIAGPVIAVLGFIIPSPKEKEQEGSQDILDDLK